MASTTSLDDTGLLDEILPSFASAHPEHEVRVLAVGTGEALELGRRGDADVVIVHAPPAELEFVRRGFGHGRTPFLRNDFVIAGDPADPAGIRGFASASEALARIAAAGATFVSRGDGSGTHLRERELWDRAGATPGGEWYLEAGQGMGATLTIAGERRAYVLTDRATLLTVGRGLDLKPLVEDDPQLANIYSVIRVSGASNPRGGEAFGVWLASEETARRIAAFGRERFGEPLFRPIPAEERAGVASPVP